MKTQINELLAAKNGYLRLNSFATLERYQEDVLGNPCDGLKVEFENTPFWTPDIEIKARDWRGVVEECKQAFTQHFTYMAEKASEELGAGYGIDEVAHIETFRDWCERKAEGARS